MKKTFGVIFAIIIIMCLCLSACTPKNTANVSIWDNATYKEDVTLGNGSKIVEVEVKAEDKSVTITLKTDKKTLGEALTEHKLVSGENSAYGLYIKFVNGMEADYSKTKSYWSFYKNGEGVNHGVDSEKIENGTHYMLECIKE